MPSLSLQNVYLPNLKLQPEGQAFDLTTTSSKLTYSPKTKEARGCLLELPLPHSSSPVSSGNGPVYMCGTLAMVATAQGPPLDCLALMASGAHVFRSHRIVINREIVPNRLPCSPAPSPRAQWRGHRQTPSLSVKEAY